MALKSSVYIFVLFLNVLLLSSCKKDSAVEPATPIVTPTETVPAAPSNLQIVSMTATGVVLTWKDNSNNEKLFSVEWGTDTVNFSTLKTTDANKDSVAITVNFLTTKTYFFRVLALNTTKISPASNVAQRSLFPPPTELTITSFTLSSATVKWNDNSTDETGFIIEQSVDAFPYSAVDSTNANVTTYTRSGPFDSAKTYSFRVVAKTSAYRSGYSNAEARTLGSWVFVAGGTFSMGRNGPFRDERPIHPVTLSGYYISKFEVTVREYRKFTDATKRTFPATPYWGWNDNAPIVNVSWNDANAYCLWLDSTTGKPYRLPTEAEWEYAARGGKNARPFPYSGALTPDSVAWYYLNAGGRTHTVGTKKPNELGIYDMSGNAWEWCYDWQGSYPTFSQTNPTGPAGGSFKIFRGGSWFDYGLYESECRVETRYAYTINGKVEDGGFRIVRSL